MALMGTMLLLLVTAPLTAEDAAEPAATPNVLIRNSPDNPVAGSTWTLTLLIDHQEPLEVDVLAPHFTGAIFLEQVIKAPRVMNPDSAQVINHNEASALPAALPQAVSTRWTAMEYRFVLNSPGIVSFDAFTVITPQGRTMTAPFDLNVRRPQNTAEVRSYRLEWEGIPPELKIGENAVFCLRYSGRVQARAPLEAAPGATPEATLFLPPVPPGFIFEPVPLTPEEVAVGIALKLRLIPLEAAPFVLASRKIAHNDVIFEIPALRIPVSQAAQGASHHAAQNLQTRGGQADTENDPIPPFPPLETALKDHSRLYQKYQSECATVYTAAKNVWEKGDRANALATLRQNERDHPAGAFFAAIRRGAEQALGFTGTNDEKKSLFKDRSRSAVLRETAVRRVPDTAGEEVAHFREGQPVLLDRKTHHTWLQVIANDHNQTSGWVPEENIIFY